MLLTMFGLRSARGRAALATAVLIVVLVVVAIVTTVRVRQHQEQVLALEDTAATVAALEHARAQLYHQMAALSSLVFSDDPALLDDYQRAAAGVEQDMSQARALALAEGDADEVLALDDLIERIGKFNQTVNLALPGLVQGDPETRVQSAAASTSEMWAEVGVIMVALDQLAVGEQAELAAERAAANDAAAVTSWIVVGFGGIALLVVIGMVIVTIASVVGPLVSLRASARAITSGDLGARAKVFGPEEVASLARDFNEMTGALAVKTEEYVAIANLTGDIIAKVDEEGRWVFLNDAACQFFGKPREELLGTDSRASVHPEDLERSVQAVQNAAATRELIERFVNRQVTPMGTRVVEWNAHPLFDQESRYVGIQMTGRDITDRKRVEEALQESEKRFRAQYKGIPVPTYTWQKVGEDLVLVDYNDAAEAITHGGVVNFLGKTASEMYQDRPQIQEELWRCFTEKISIKREMVYRFEYTGESKHVAVTYAPVPPDLILVHTEDISERKRAEGALAAKTKDYIDTVNLTGDVIARLDKDGRFTFVNDSACQSFGKPREELLGTEAGAFLHPEDLEAASRAVEGVMESKGALKEFESRLVTPTGTKVVEWNGNLFFDDEGQYAGIQITGRDITERKRVEEALRTKDSAIESSITGIALADLQGNLTYVNSSLLRMWGYDHAEEILGKPVAEFWQTKEKAREVGKALRDRGSWIGELVAIRKGGSTLDVQLSTSMVTDEVGRPICMMGSFLDITERKRAEEELQSSEERLKVLFESAPDAYYLNDLEGRFVDGNNAAQKMIGYKKEELIGKSFLEAGLLPPKQLRQAAGILAKSAQGVPTGPDELALVRKDGNEVPVEIRTFPVKIKDQTLILGIGRDITERKKAEEALAAKTKEYVDTTNLTGDIMAKLDKRGRWAFLNDAACQFYGKPREELLGSDSRDFVHPDDAPSTIEAIRETRASKKLITGFVNRQITPMGTRVVEWDGYPVCDEEGQYAGIQITGRDITERQQMEKGLRESEEKYRRLVQDSTDGIAIVQDGEIRFVNRALLRMYGGDSEEEMVGRLLSDFVSPEYRELMVERSHAREEGQDVPPQYEFKALRKDGTEFDAEIAVSKITYEGKVASQGVIRDITERKKAEEALRESEERYRLLAENTSDLIWTMDLGLRYTYMSPIITHMRGYTVEEVMAQTVNESMTPASREVAVKTLAEELAMERMEPRDIHRSRKLELEMYCKDGSTIWTEMNMTFLRDSDGNPIGILGVTRDISERKRAEEERERLHIELEMRAITDSLTGLYDHAHFYQRLAEEIGRSKRYNHGFAVVMMDIDDFKRFNDSRGHQLGDEVLRLVAGCIQAGLRRSDIAFRYGGDEFAAILPHADSSKAGDAVNRMNGRITKSLKQLDGGTAARLSLSAGVACFPDDGTTADDLVRIADAALYNAKWVARARDIMGQREDIQSLVSALVSRRTGVEGPASGAIFRPEALHEQQARIVSSVASSIAVALKDAGVAQALEDPDLQVLATVGAAAEIKDRYIRGHPERTSEQAVALAEEMGLSPQRVRDIRIAGLLHDIGKVTVSEGILNKPGKLTKREFASIKDHPVVGATLVSQVKGFERLVPIVRHHHERFDGRGYPDGVAGEDIPPEARILSVVDVFDALTHQRSYRKAMSKEEAIAELERGAGTQFDPVVVEAFLALVNGRGGRLAAPAQAASKDRQLAPARAPGRGKG